MGQSLMIVESPKKAKTIGAFLAAGGYRVEASFGHVRDLPPKQLGIDVERGFEPTYAPVPRARPHLAKLREAARVADRVLLATDPDREGEAIAWHLVAALGLRPGSYARVTFHEITPAAVRAALATPRQLDQALVDAQQARRVLDRLVGYQVSPLLWRKVQRGTSAGRVQSVALRLVVEREREISAFAPEEYWTVTVRLTPHGAGDAEAFAAGLAELDGRKPELRDRAAAEATVGWLRDAATSYAIISSGSRTRERTPPPPFTTSTLQQAAANRLRLPAKRTMALAQSLYEDGLITYHRTDAVYSAPESVAAARGVIESQFGPEYLPPRPRLHASRQKNAQEAHEAIRPADPTRRPDPLGPKSDADERRLYELIWQRFVASQMAAARYLIDLASVVAEHPAHSARLDAKATALAFPGYLAVYGAEEGGEEHSSGDGLPPNRKLPLLEAGGALRFLDANAGQHFTQPPARYTEASLVQALESLGVGRPSTYAAILSTIEERSYVTLAVAKAARLRTFEPTELGFAANDFLCRHFAEVIDPTFTARMEEGLDEVARGGEDWRQLLGRFYERFVVALDGAKGAEKVEIATPPPAPKRSRSGPARLKPEPTGEVCSLCGKALLKRTGKRGPFVGCAGYPACGYTRDAAPSAGGEGKPKRPRATSKGSAAIGARAARPKGAAMAPGRSVAAPTSPCPRCGKALVERTQRSSGDRFLGCSGFPTCRFTSPLPPGEAAARKEEMSRDTPGRNSTTGPT